MSARARRRTSSLPLTACPRAPWRALAFATIAAATIACGPPPAQVEGQGPVEGAEPAGVVEDPGAGGTPTPPPIDPVAPAPPVDTVSPTEAGPTVASTSYKPAEDTRNHAPGGFDLSAARDPADRADAQKRPFSIDTLYSLVSVGSPQISPDGTNVLFTVTRNDVAAGTSNTDIYMIYREGTNLRRMTHDKASDGHPRWSPDGKTFLFTSSRGGSSQVWRMPAFGGEAEQLTDVPTGVSGPEWTPDGKGIVFTSRVFPEFGADAAKNKALLDDIKASPVKAHIADDLLFRHWKFYKDGRRAHILHFDIESETVVDLTPGDFDSPAFSPGGGTGWDISPDGKELCFSSNRDPANQRSWTTNKDLYVAPLVGPGGTAQANPVNLTDANEAFDGHPVYSPDGRYIAFLRQDTPTYEADRFRLALYDRRSGETRILSDALDNSVSSMRWVEDGTALVFKASEKGRTPLFRVSVEGGPIEKLKLPSVRSWTTGSGAIVFTYSRIGAPVELFTSDPRGGMPHRITGLNDDIVKTHDIRPAEELWIDGANGRKIHTFVVKPHGYQPGKRYPLILNVHGGPQSQWTDNLRGDWQVYPGAGYVVAFANPHGSTGYGQDFTAAISKDWGGKVYEDLMKVTDRLAAEPYVDPERMGAMGWSYGGYMMNWFLGHTTRFKAIASMMGIFELDSFYGATEELWFPEWDFGGPLWAQREGYTRWSPSTYVDKMQTPTLIVTGERDYRVPYTQSLQLFTALRRRDVPARIVVFPNDGHWPSHVKSMPLYYAAHLDWFHRYLGGEPSPYTPQDLVNGRAFGKPDE